MVTRFKQTAKPRAGAAFTLVEVVMSVTILALAMAGMIYGYAQTNYRAEWSSMSLAVQALTVQSVERVRAARWDVYSSVPSGADSRRNSETERTRLSLPTYLPTRCWFPRAVPP